MDITELRLAAIVESSDDAIIGKELDGTITFWNRAAERMFGFAAGEAIGEPITLIIPEDRHDEEAEVLRRIRRGELVSHFETVRRRRDGTLIDISLTISPIRNASGQVIGASTIARDITERKRAVTAMAELHRRLQGLVLASSSLLRTPDIEHVHATTIAIARELLSADGYAIWRREARIGWRMAKAVGVSGAFASRTITSYRGHPAPASLEFTEPLRVEDVSAEPLLTEHLDAFRREGIQSMLALPLLHGARTGSLVFYYRERHTFSDVEVDLARALANIAATAMNTAELYQAAELGKRRAAFLADAGSLLAQSLDYEQTLAGVASLAVPDVADWCAVDVVKDDGQIERLAVAHVDPAKIALAKSFQEHYPEDPQSRHGVHEVIRTGRPVMLSSIPDDLLVAAARDAGHLQAMRELAVTSFMRVPLQAHGTTMGVLTFVSAESGREYGEDDLRLAEDVAARAALAMANARTYQERARLLERERRARAEADAANRAKDEFLAVVSHELRTPLNAIVGYVKMLRMEMLDAEQRVKALATVDRNAVALQEMIEDVLDVSRIMTGKLRLNVQPVQLSEVLTEALASVTPAADAKGVRLQTVIDTAVLPVSGDPGRLQQVVWNMLSNAVKFTPRGGRVQLRLERVNAHVEIVVSDTGQGIEPEFLPYVFERFRQEDSRFSRTHGGLGLGLSIVREIVELHGGTVSAASDGPGTGATFRVKLPLMIDASGIARGKRARASPPRGPDVNGQAGVRPRRRHPRPERRRRR